MSKGNIRFEVKGIKEAMNALSVLPKQLSDKVLYNVNRDAAVKIVKKQMEADAPEGNNTKRNKSKIRQNVTVVKQPAASTGVLIGLKKKVFYAVFLDMGTKVRTLLGRGKYRKGTRRGRIAARPFARESHNRSYPKVINHFENHVLKIISRSLKRLVKRFR